jgi:uncharacterized protein
MGSSSQSLCRACGLCCDGTLFPSTALRSAEEVDAARAVGFDVVAYRDRNAFLQPCPAYRDCACTVYANRPPSCREFRCELLKKLEQGDVSQEAAHEIVKSTLAAKNALLGLAGVPSANDPQLWALIRTCIKDLQERTARARLFFSFIVLQRTLDRFFRDKPRFTSQGRWRLAIRNNAG